MGEVCFLRLFRLNTSIPPICVNLRLNSVFVSIRVDSRSQMLVAPSAFVPRSQNYGGQDGATGFRGYSTIAKPNPNPARTFVSFVNFCKKSLSSCPL